MRLFRRFVVPRFPKAANLTWQLSENGNPTLQIDGHHVTVFRSDGGWKYCIADNDDNVRHFSDIHPTQSAAKRFALAELYAI